MPTTVVTSIGSRTADSVTINTVTSVTVSGYANAWDLVLSAAVPTTTVVGDSITRSSLNYLILAVSGSTLTVTSNPFGHTTAPTTGTATTQRAYSSIGAWEDACPSNLVTSDQIWKGELYREGGGTNGQWDISATPINVGGITSDATRYMWLAAASGQSWYDNANKLTNPFRFDAATGVAIQIAGNYTCLVESTNTGLRFTGLQIRSAADLSGLNIARQPARFERCIIEWRKGSPAFRFGQTLINCLVWIRESGGSVCNGTSVESGNYRNTTFIGPGSGTAFTTLQYSSNNVIRNCAVFNFSSIIGNSAHWTGADCLNNATDLSAFGIGSSNQTSLTYSAQFTNTTSGSEDFRSVESGSLDGNGVRDQTFTDDLDAPGQTRSTTAPTIGAWEVVAAAAPDELFELNDAEQQAAVRAVLDARNFATQIATFNSVIPVGNRANVNADAASSATKSADPAETARAVLAATLAAVDGNTVFWLNDVAVFDFEFVGTGGIVFGGEGIEVFTRDFADVSTGGILFGGEGVEAFTRVFSATGDGGIVFAGDAVEDIEIGFSVTGSGGITFGGEGVETFTRIFNATGSGGITFGGEGVETFTRIFNVTGSGGITFGGDATETADAGFNVTGSGGITFGGDATEVYAPIFVFGPTGGILFGGAAIASLDTGAGLRADHYIITFRRRRARGR